MAKIFTTEEDGIMMITIKDTDLEQICIDVVFTNPINNPPAPIFEDDDPEEKEEPKDSGLTSTLKIPMEFLKMIPADDEEQAEPEIEEDDQADVNFDDLSKKLWVVRNTDSIVVRIRSDEIKDLDILSDHYGDNFLVDLEEIRKHVDETWEPERFRFYAFDYYELPVVDRQAHNDDEPDCEFVIIDYGEVRYPSL